MTTIEIKDASGKKAGTADLAASVFGIEPNVPVIHQVVRAQRASWRQGTHDTKTRGQVRRRRSRGARRAPAVPVRAPSAPQWAGGGTVFGPHPRSYAFRVNNKEVKLAMRSALSAKLADGELFVVDAFNFEKPSTKAAVAALKALGLERRTTLVIDDEDVNTYLSFRNIPTVNILPVSAANTYELIDNKALVFTADALKRIEEVLA